MCDASQSHTLGNGIILHLVESHLTSAPFRQILHRIERLAGHPT
jgi:hypothetical protein